MFSIIMKNVANKVKTNIFNRCSFYSSYSNKTFNCCDVDLNLCEQNVTLYGWLHNSRMGGNIILLRDSSGIIQLISNNNSVPQNLPPIESVIKVSGVVKKRPEHQINKKMKSGFIEVLIDNLEVLNEADKYLPFYTRDTTRSSEMLRMKNRHLDLRNEVMQQILKFRSTVEFIFSEFLVKNNNFVNISTPSLFKSTPGGSREFIVPTKESGMCYSLIQSPQQHKQLLMIGGIERYMQIARCYRNEMSRPDRQPEFTQLDIEMAFVDRSHLQALVQDMFRYSLTIFKKQSGLVRGQFPVLSFDESMKLYGTDRPDLRFDLTIENYLQSDVEFLGLRLTREYFKYLNVESIIEQIRKNYPDKTIQIVNFSESKMYSETLKKELNEDYAFILKNSNDISDYKTLGNIRNIIGSQLNLIGKSLYKGKYAFAWVDRFPLFEMKNGVIQSVHHQFTAPIKEHYELLYTNPEKVIGEQFDLVCNGVELGGGSIRVHNSDMQEYIIKHILKEDVSLFSHLLTALRSGAPPHGGFALGIDRLIAVITGCNSIRDVIAFPKTVDGRDLLSGAPSEITVDQCDYYNLCFTNKSTVNGSYGNKL